MHKISIIIPIYNVEHYLSQCLDSVINQTYQNLEIILVNDGSIDNSAEICNKYAVLDERIKVIHKSNEGSAAARNEGLNIATGELIGFIDSDDIVALDFFEKLFKTLQENTADIAECGFIEFENHIPHISKSSLTSNHYEEYDTEASIQAYLDGPLSVVVWNKLYRKEVLKDIFFPKGKYIDDIFWTYKVFSNSAKTARIAEVLYFYRKHEDSITGRNYSLKRLDALLAWEEMIIFIEKKFPNILQQFQKAYCFLLIDNYIQLKLNHDLDSDRFHRNIILEKIKNYNYWTEFKKWKWKDVIWYKLFLWSPSGYALLRKYMDKRSKRINMQQ